MGGRRVGFGIGAACATWGCLLAAAPAAAQVCIGIPSVGGQVSVQANFDLSDGATGYAGVVRGNLEGPLSIAGGIGIIDFDGVDSNATTFSASAAYEMHTEGFGACPVVGAGYATWNDRITDLDVDVSVLSFPVGFAVGVQLGDDGGMRLVPSAEAGLIHQRARVELAQGGVRLTESDSETEFYVSAGATVALTRFFARAGVFKMTADGSDAVVSLAVGLRF